jgi:trans-aconitate methyltransferase
MDDGRELVELLAPARGERILDAGCGLGRMAAAMSAMGAEVTGIDREAAPLEQARLAAPAARFVQADLLEYSGESGFDAIVSRGALHWVVPAEAAAARLFGLLRPGGRLAAEWGGIAKELSSGCWIPTVGEAAGLLEGAGFDVRLAAAYEEGPGRTRRVRLLAFRPEGEER